MFSFNKLGQKFRAGIGLGRKFLGTVGRLGQKVASGFESAYNVASGFPIVGHAIKSSPLVQGLRGVVSGVGEVAKIATSIGDVVEKGGYDARTAHDVYGRVKRGVRVGRHVRSEASHLFNRGDHETNQGHTSHG